jgi:uncharacterized membrane protein
VVTDRRRVVGVSVGITIGVIVVMPVGVIVAVVLAVVVLVVRAVSVVVEAADAADCTCGLSAGSRAAEVERYD